jgi:hypothetical protein
MRSGRKRNATCVAARVVPGALLLALLVTAVTAGVNAFCQSEVYLFEVPTENVTVTINRNASIDIDYVIDFRNDPDGDPIDIVDIGMPTPNYDLSACSASVNGAELRDIRPSEFVSPGVEVRLGDQAIMPGDEGTFTFHGNNPQMVFQDSGREGYASVEFRNTWWGSQYARGETFLTVSMVFPPGVRNNETVYHRQEEPGRSTVDGRIMFTWTKPDAEPSRGYTYGVSFPAAYVEGVYPYQPPPDYEPVYTSTTTSSYSGSSRYMWSYILPIVVVVVASILRFGLTMGRARSKGVKPNYIAPAVGIEGAGPMKELYPAEAAVLMNQDLDRAAAVAYIELMQKNLVSLESLAPLTLKRTARAPENLPAYYPEFLAAVTTAGSLDRTALKLALTNLIKSTESKVKGFGHEETVEYYEDASARSWAAVKTEADHTARMKKFDQYLPFLVMDRAFGSKVREAFGAGGFPLFSWATGLAGAAGGPATGVTTAPGGTLSIAGSSFADAVAGGFRSLQDAAFIHVQEFEEQVVKEVNPLEHRRVYRPYWGYGGFRGGGGGAGCACACACAGCACACAGGGR